MMKIVVYMLFVLLICGKCKTYTKNNNLDQDSIVQLLLSNNYKTLYRKQDIPENILDSLSIINGGKFEIADSSDIGNIDFSDADLKNYKYKRKINFICSANDVFLICYRQGGIGTHDILDCFDLKDYHHKRYTTMEDLSTKENLVGYLERK